MSITTLKNYVDGQWVEPDHDGWLDVTNPSTGLTIARVPLSTPRAIAQAVDAAEAAFPTWSRQPISARCEYLFRLVARLHDHSEELARCISQENGKSLTDARAEMKRTLENCQVACGAPSLLQGDTLTGCGPDIDGEVLHAPVGVFGIVAPFNFPAMVPFWFLPYAVAAGNTVLVKASEQVPCTLQRIFELIDGLGLPPGVMNLIHGDRTAAQALIACEKVAGISSVGSTATARSVTQACVNEGKRVQAFGGAKNYLVVMPDAKMGEVIRNMVTSCYGCAGQRCMAASAIACVGDETYRTVLDRFVTASREVVVGNPLDPNLADEPMLMGPVISDAARQRICNLIDSGVQEGATLALDGRGVRVRGADGGYFIGPTVLADVKPGMTVEREEIFGPVVVMIKCDSLDEAIATINQHRYGNGASIYTQNGHHARRFKLQTQAGMIGINVGIPAPVAALPFGGMKESCFANIRAQSREVLSFFTGKRIITERYWPELG